MLSRPPSPAGYNRRLVLVCAIVFSLIAWAALILAVARLT
jgi:hypothetical protein